MDSSNNGPGLTPNLQQRKPIEISKVLGLCEYDDNLRYNKRIFNGCLCCKGYVYNNDDCECHKVDTCIV